MTDPPSQALAVAVVQFAPDADRRGNLEELRRRAADAARLGAKLIVFPEYSSFFTPHLGAESVAAAQTLDGEFVTEVAAIATQFDVFVVAGMLETAGMVNESGRPEQNVETHRAFNTIVALDPRRGLVAVYRKQHLYDAFGQSESDFIIPGDLGAPQVFQVGDLTVGIQTCYDLRFPEVTRRIVDAGADLVLVPSEWVRGPLKEHHWRTLITARAIENTIYVAAADHAPPIGVGNSMVVDPMGAEIATIGEEAGLAIGWVSRDRIHRVRSVNPALSLRRFTVVAR